MSRNPIIPRPKSQIVLPPVAINVQVIRTSVLLGPDEMTILIDDHRPRSRDAAAPRRNQRELPVFALRAGLQIVERGPDDWRRAVRLCRPGAKFALVIVLGLQVGAVISPHETTYPEQSGGQTSSHDQRSAKCEAIPSRTKHN